MEARDPAAIARIERDHRLAPEAADLAIVFGTRIAAPGMAEAAAFLFLPAEDRVPRAGGRAACRLHRAVPYRRP